MHFSLMLFVYAQSYGKCIILLMTEPCGIGFQVFTAVNFQTVVVCVVRVCGNVGAYQRFGGTRFFHPHVIFNPKNGSSVFILNFCIHLQDYTVRPVDGGSIFPRNVGLHL
jgi:hypothetical protein